MIGTTGVFFFFLFFFSNKQVKKLQSQKKRKKSLSSCSIFCLVSPTYATDLAYLPYPCPRFAPGSVTLHASDLSGLGGEETTVFHRDGVEPSHRSRETEREGGEKKLLMAL